MWKRKALGHGIGLRPQHYGHILAQGPRDGAGDVDWMEVISENYFEPGGRPWKVLESVRARMEVVAHGVSLGIGNTDALSMSYLQRLKAFVERIEPAWVSDHLCWGGWGGHYAHDLLPLPYTEEALAHVVERVQRVQDFLCRQIMLENVSSYVTFVESSLPEWQFLKEVAERADCGILLDVNNIYVSSINHHFSAQTYIDAIPTERIGQIHLAGHTDKGTHLLDTHIGPVPQVVWDLYRKVVARVKAEEPSGVPVPTLVEWDEEVPAYEVVVAEAQRSRAIEKEVLTVRASGSASVMREIPLCS